MIKTLLILSAATMIVMQSSTDWNKKGTEITDAIGKVLMSNVQTAMKAGGPPNAVAYCNAMAMPQTDSLSTVHNVEVRRTSLKYRNPSNAPSAQEERVLKRMEFMTVEGEPPPPAMIEEVDGQVHFYRPIMVQQPCLNCHGERASDVSQATLDLLQQTYPEDNATGYSVGQLRGMWHLTFEKN